MRKFYAVTNQYGSNTSIGFSNTWIVLAFKDKKSRDEYVENGDLSTMSILKRNITKYVDNWPRAFTGEYYCIDRDSLYQDVNGCYGQVRVAQIDEWPKPEYLF